MDIILRNYQKECLQKMFWKYTNYPGNYLVQMAVGMGKTVVFSNFIKHINGRMLILSHREELVKQPKKYFDCSFGIEMGKHKSNGEKVISASVQTFVRRIGKFSPDDFDVIIVDEAHHTPAKTYQKIINSFNPRCIFGFTATPTRGDRIGLEDTFEEIIYTKDLRWGIENKFLSNIECRRVDIGYDLRGVKKYQKDFNQVQLEEAVNISQANDAIAECYYKIARGQTIIFGCSVKHCYEIQKRIANSRVISSFTEKNEREQTLKDFMDKKFDCLINCMILTEGTDLPCIETIIMARPTKNESLYCQCVGRGTRLYEGKTNLLLIDCVGVSEMQICTAPTLLGLKADNVLDKDMLLIEGDLFALEDKINRLEDNPISWIKNITTVNLWAKNNKLDTHNVNYIKMSNGDLYLNIPNTKLSLYINKPDELGNTIVNIPDGKGNYNRIAAPIQKIFDNTYKTLCNKYSEYKSIWDINSIKGWRYSPATDKQKQWIEKKLDGNVLEMIDIDKLTKYDAANILSRVFAAS